MRPPVRPDWHNPGDPLPPDVVINADGTSDANQATPGDPPCADCSPTNIAVAKSQLVPQITMVVPANVSRCS